jgi:hypothetical protein
MVKRELEVNEVRIAREEAVKLDEGMKAESRRWIEEEVEELERWDGME